MPETRESLPVASGQAESISTAIKAAESILPPTAPRCLACGHVITCDESIRAGLGRDCRRRIRRLALAMTP